MLVRSFMSEPVFTLEPAMSCAAALHALRARGVRRAPVLEAGALVGMVTEGNLLAVLPGTPATSETEAGRRSLEIPVRQVMAGDVVTARPGDTLADVAARMLRHKIGGLPVVENGVLRGIISESDVFRALTGMLAAPRGCRILIEERGQRTAIDHARLAERHGCTLRALLETNLAGGGRMVWLRVEGGDVDALLDAMWKEKVTIVSVERHDRPA